MDVFNTEFRKKVQGIAADAVSRLRSAAWPGNIRELRNAVERAMLLSETPVLAAHDFPMIGDTNRSALTEAVSLPAAGINLDELERSLVVQALERAGWNQTRAAGSARPESRSDPLPHRKVQARTRGAPVVIQCRGRSART